MDEKPKQIDIFLDEREKLHFMTPPIHKEGLSKDTLQKIVLDVAKDLKMNAVRKKFLISYYIKAISELSE